MNKEIRTKLIRLECQLIDEASEMDTESEEFEKAMHNIERIHKMLNDDERLIVDKRLKEDDKADLKFWVEKVIVPALGVAIPTGVTMWCFTKGMKFEETGTFTSVGMRNIVSKTTPKLT